MVRSLKYPALSVAVYAAVLFVCGGASAADDAQYAKAKKNYETYCVQCHGLGRNGKGVNTPDMPVQPRDHSDAKTMGDIPDEQIMRAIKEGGLAVNKSVLMPAWGNVLNDEEIKEMLAYLRYVCKCGSSK